MKKLISVLLSAVMMISVCGVSAIPAMAAFVGSIETTSKGILIEVTVDGEESIHGKYHTTDNSEEKGYEHEIEFTYDGDDPLKYWEIPGLTEGEDYVIVSDDGNKIVIGIINEDVDYVLANAVTGNEKVTASSKVNKNRKSPSTGAGAFGVALSAAGAGAAVVCALKKKSK